MTCIYEAEGADFSTGRMCEFCALTGESLTEEGCNDCECFEEDE